MIFVWNSIFEAKDETHWSVVLLSICFVAFQITGKFYRCGWILAWYMFVPLPRLYLGRSSALCFFFQLTRFVCSHVSSSLIVAVSMAFLLLLTDLPFGCSLACCLGKLLGIPLTLWLFIILPPHHTLTSFGFIYYYFTVMFCMIHFVSW